MVVIDHTVVEAAVDDFLAREDMQRKGLSADDDDVDLDDPPKQNQRRGDADP